MSAYVGTFSIGEIYVGSDKISEAYVGSDLVYQSLQVKTFRFKFSDTSFDPSTTLASANLTWTVVNASKGIWDAKNIGTSYAELFRNLLSTTNMGSVTCELTGANTPDMVDAAGLFRSCTALTSIGKMKMPNVTNANLMCADCTKLGIFTDTNMDSLLYAGGMFMNCSVLQIVPNLGQLPNIAECGGMFQNCRYVYTGILAMYNILSTRVTTYTNYRQCFRYCGSNTGQGSAELAQIPSGWK